MRLRQLEYFVAIADAGSYSAAAARLFVAQPSLSQQIRSLEAELGGQLFERTPQGVRLTDGGQVFLNEARGLLAASERAVRAVRVVFEGGDAELVVASVRSIASGVLPAFVSQWHAEVPGTVLHLADFNHRRLVEAAVADGSADIGVGPRPPVWDGDVVALGFEQIVAVGEVDGLAAGAPLPPEAAASAEWVLYEDQHGFSEVMARYFARHGIVPNVSARSAQVEASLLYAVEGVGTTLVPANAVHGSWLSYVHPCSPPFFREVVAFAPTGASALVGRCVETMTRARLPLTPASDLPPDAVLV